VDSKEQVKTNRTTRSRLLRVSWILLAVIPLGAWLTYSSLMAGFDCTWLDLMMGDPAVLSCTVHSSNIDYGLVQSAILWAMNVGNFANLFIVPLAFVLFVTDLVTSVKRNRTN
jgi:hypothetical protein